MGRLGTDRLWFAGGAAGILVLALVAWFMLISPTFSNATSLNDQTQSAQTQNDTLRSKIRKLQADSANAAALVSELAAARDALPADSGVPAFTRQLAAQAAAAHVALKSITVGLPVVVASSPTAPAAPATGTPSTGSAAAGQLYTIPITLITEGAAGNQRAFLQAVQQAGPRSALVVSAQLSPGSGATSGSISAASSMTTQLQVFSAPLSPAAAAELATQLGKANN